MIMINISYGSPFKDRDLNTRPAECKIWWILKMTAFWDIVLCSLVEVDWRFRGHCPYDGRGSKKRLSTSAKTTQCRSLDHTRRPEHLNYYFECFYYLTFRSWRWVCKTHFVINLFVTAAGQELRHNASLPSRPYSYTIMTMVQLHSTGSEGYTVF
jgi:hypothetical protein